MSIADLATGDTVVPQTRTNTPGASFGNTPSWDDGTALDCNVQTGSISESLAYDARGEQKSYNVFFATDPSLTKQMRLKWTKTNGNGTTFASPRYLRIMATEEERDPEGEDILYVASCQLETTRNATG